MNSCQSAGQLGPLEGPAGQLGARQKHEWLHVRVPPAGRCPHWAWAALSELHTAAFKAGQCISSVSYRTVVGILTPQLL